MGRLQSKMEAVDLKPLSIFKKGASSAVFLILLAHTPLAFAENEKNFLNRFYELENVHGYAQTRNYVDLKRTSSQQNVYQPRNDWRMEIPFKVSQSLSGLVSSHAQLDYGLHRDDFHSLETDIKLHEAYLDFYREKWNIRAGRQVIRWGRGDEINPTDDFTPENFKEFFNFERADRKMPITAANLKYLLTEATSLEGIWIPFFEPDVFDETGKDWKFFLPKTLEAQGFTFFHEKTPGRKLSNSTLAARLQHSSASADFSLTYSYHFEQTPTYKLRQDPLFFFGLAPSPGSVETLWPREHTIGGDFEAPFKEWVFRGEAGYVFSKPHPTNNSGDEDAFIRRDTLQTIVGADHSFKNNVYLNLQLAQNFIINRAAGMPEQSYKSYAVFRVRRAFMHDKLKLQLSGIYEWTDINYYYKPEFTYEIKENLELNAGFFIFQGKAESFFGQFENNDQVFMNLKYYY